MYTLMIRSLSCSETVSYCLSVELSVKLALPAKTFKLKMDESCHAYTHCCTELS